MIQSIDTFSGHVGFSKPVLVIGNKGMLGRAWTELLTHQSIDHWGCDFEQIDITDPRSVNSQIDDGIGTVINCAAWTDVDGAEENCLDAYRVNAFGVQNLAHRCRQIGAKLVQFSTDYVFDGESDAEYDVDSLPNPISVYGRTKYACEKLTEESGCEYLLIRTSWMYSPWGKNFPDTILRLVQERPNLKIIDDQRGRPTSAQGLANRCLSLLRCGAQGLYQISDGGKATWYEFACEIASHVDHACDIQPCTTEDFPLPAKRPRNSVMSLQKVESEIGKCIHWKLALAEVMRSKATATEHSLT